MPTILEALKIKDGNNTPADTITDFLREKRSTILPYTDHTIASYISNGEDYDPIAPVVTNDSQGVCTRVLNVIGTYTFTKLKQSYTSKYKGRDFAGLYMLAMLSGTPTVTIPEEDELSFFIYTDANGITYRIPGMYSPRVSETKLMSPKDFCDTFVIPNQGKKLMGFQLLSRLLDGTVKAPTMIFSIPSETGDTVRITNPQWFSVKEL